MVLGVVQYNRVSLRASFGSRHIRIAQQNFAPISGKCNLLLGEQVGGNSGEIPPETIET